MRDFYLTCHVKSIKRIQLAIKKKPLYANYIIYYN